MFLPSKILGKVCILTLTAGLLIGMFLLSANTNTARAADKKALDPVSIYKAGNLDKDGYLIFEVKVKEGKFRFPLASKIGDWKNSAVWLNKAKRFMRLLPGLPGKKSNGKYNWNDFFSETVEDFYRTVSMKMTMADGKTRVFKFLPDPPGHSRLPPYDPSAYFMDVFVEWEDFVRARETLDDVLKDIKKDELVVPDDSDIIRIPGLDRLRKANFKITAVQPLINTIIRANVEDDLITIKRGQDVYSTEEFQEIIISHDKFEDLRSSVRFKVVFGDKKIATVLKDNFFLSLLVLLLIIGLLLVIVVLAASCRKKSRDADPKKLESTRRERLAKFYEKLDDLRNEVDYFSDRDFKAVMGLIDDVLKGKRERFARDINEFESAMKSFWEDRLKDVMKGFESVFSPLAASGKFDKLFDPNFWLYEKEAVLAGSLKEFKKTFSTLEMDLPNLIKEISSQLARAGRLVNNNLRSYKDILHDLKLEADFNRLSEILGGTLLGAPGNRVVWTEAFLTMAENENTNALKDMFWKEIWEGCLADAVQIVQEAMFKIDLVLMSLQEDTNGDEKVTRLYELKMTVNAVYTVFQSIALANGRVCHPIGPLQRMSSEFYELLQKPVDNILGNKLFEDCVKHYEVGKQDEVVDVMNWGVSAVGKRRIETAKGVKSTVVLYKDRFKKKDAPKPETETETATRKIEKEPGGAQAKPAKNQER